MDLVSSLNVDSEVPLCGSVVAHLVEHRRVLGEVVGGGGDVGDLLLRAGESIRGLIRLVEVLASAPPGYPDCTSAVVRAMGEPFGVDLLRVMHRNQELIARQAVELVRLRGSWRV